MSLANIALSNTTSVSKRLSRSVVLALVGCFALGAAHAQDKPNILVIWGDDIGWMNPSAYHRGMMGYETPNIDRIANEGALFTDWYGQQSCTAGPRSSPGRARSAPDC